jgi:hypothetical protein
MSAIIQLENKYFIAVNSTYAGDSEAPLGKWFSLLLLPAFSF